MFGYTNGTQSMFWFIHKIGFVSIIQILTIGLEENKQDISLIKYACLYLPSLKRSIFNSMPKFLNIVSFYATLPVNRVKTDVAFTSG